MPVRGLTLLVAGADPARFRSALELAATQAALGGRSRLFLQAPAVPLITGENADDGHWSAAGLPTPAALIDVCLELGADIVLCQSGLALAGLDLGDLDTRLSAGGLTGILATMGDDRLVAL